MAKEKKIISASTGKETTGGKTVIKAKPSGSSAGYRVGAVLLWIAAIALEVLALLVFLDKINLKFIPQLWQIIIFLVLDLACVIIGSLLWKKANHINPASKKNAFLFWLWNNMGVVVCAFAFVPFIIVALTDKKADKKTKAIATVVAVIALLIGGLASYEWNPISAEEKQSAVNAIEGEVYWTQFGRKYHTADDCGALANSETLYKGSVEEAISSGKTDLCAFCAKRDNITGVRVDGEGSGLAPETSSENGGEKSEEKSEEDAA